MDRGAWQVQSVGSQESDMTERLSATCTEHIPIRYSSLLPTRSVFNLAVSCLTTSSLPWLLSLSFQVPMQYHPLQLWSLPSLPDTSTAEHHFCFHPAASHLLDLLVIALCSSPVAYQTPSTWGVADLLASYLFAFSYHPQHSCSKNSGVGYHFFLQWTTFCQNSLLWPISFGWPCMAWPIFNSFIELHKPLCHKNSAIHEGNR